VAIALFSLKQFLTLKTPPRSSAVSIEDISLFQRRSPVTASIQ
jgi:hypothetical protein